MQNKLKSGPFSSRHTLSLLGLGAAASFALPAAILSGSDAIAQTRGMERRDDRRDDRQERRNERRSKKKTKKKKQEHRWIFVASAAAFGDVPASLHGDGVPLLQ